MKVATIQEPETFSEAAKDPWWVEAMNEDMQALSKNKKWDLVPPSHHQKAIGWRCCAFRLRIVSWVGWEPLMFWTKRKKNTNKASKELVEREVSYEFRESHEFSVLKQYLDGKREFR